jgi:hypothetical protein
MGCYTYFPVSNNEFSNINQEKKVKIVLKDKREFIVKNIADIYFSNTDKIEIYQNDNSLVIFSLTEIEKISEERFDFGKTIFTGMWITIGVISALIIIINISSDGKGIRIG